MTGARFVAMVGVREDEGLLAPCVANLRRIGFDHVVLVCVEDFAQQAPKVAALYAGDAGVSIVPFPTVANDASFLELSGAPIGPVIEAHRPDWLMMLDVDEFPVVRGGHLSGLHGLEEADCITIQRYNFARRRGEGENDILAKLNEPELMPLITDRRDAKSDLASTAGPRWSFHTIAPRVLFRPQLFRRLGIGAHGVTGWQGVGAGPTHVNSADMCIVHLPFTSYQRFEQKVRNIQAHLAGSKFLEGQLAWHWKFWLRRFGERALAAEYDAEALTEEEFSLMSAAGGILTSERILAISGDAARDDPCGAR